MNALMMIALFFCGLVIGGVLMCVITSENVTFYKRLANKRGVELVDKKAEINKLKRQLNLPEDLIDA